jgi:hypothetical protein
MGRGSPWYGVRVGGLRPRRRPCLYHQAGLAVSGVHADPQGLTQDETPGLPMTSPRTARWYRRCASTAPPSQATRAGTAASNSAVALCEQNGYLTWRHLAAMVNHIVGVTGGHLAHEDHGNEADRRSDVTTQWLRLAGPTASSPPLPERPSVLVSKNVLNGVGLPSAAAPVSARPPTSRPARSAAAASRPPWRRRASMCSGISTPPLCRDRWLRRTRPGGVRRFPAGS